MRFSELPLGDYNFCSSCPCFQSSNLFDFDLSTMSFTDKAPFVMLETSMGKICLELYWDHAPKTCRNFSELARRGYYNGTIFHRIIADFMIQGGDPTGTGRGGASIYGDRFADEISEKLRHTGAGVLSMANAGPNTNGSQFFITLAPTQHLDGKHTIFGRVAAGMKVVQNMGKVDTDNQDRPRAEVRIIKAYPSDDSRFT
ncbi:Peptidyl-prolyl cis-trans isomerase [Trichostrongylus colubriformis]|uniref:Peptidyl-prolyl cis-trans isomerase n=2 Tax=Trichostrongylus colubriformis TaxID=6319 RepID=A0AAN8FX09_TRICO